MGARRIPSRSIARSNSHFPTRNATEFETTRRGSFGAEFGSRVELLPSRFEARAFASRRSRGEPGASDRQLLVNARVSLCSTWAFCPIAGDVSGVKAVVRRRGLASNPSAADRRSSWPRVDSAWVGGQAVERQAVLCAFCAPAALSETVSLHSGSEHCWGQNRRLDRCWRCR